MNLQPISYNSKYYYYYYPIQFLFINMSSQLPNGQLQKQHNIQVH